MFRTDYALQPTSSQATAVSPKADGLWFVLLHNKQAPNIKTQRLLTTLGATASLTTASHVAMWKTGAVPFTGFDLILYEALGVESSNMQAVLYKVRTHSKTPLIVLAGGAHPEQTVTALRAGADAVIPLTLHQEIITAHFFALLRRWGRHPHAAHPSFASAPLA